MKALLFLIFCGIIGYYGYQHFSQTPIPKPEPTRRLAPRGIYFTTERVTEQTEFGLNALKAGSRVKLIDRKGENSVVIDDKGMQLTVPSHVLTDDMDVRDAVLKTIVDQSEKAAQQSRAEDIIANEAQSARIARLNREISRLTLQLEELGIKRSRADEKLNAEMARSKQVGVSGKPMQGEVQTRSLIQGMDSQIKILKRKIEDAQFAIRKEQL